MSDEASRNTAARNTAARNTAARNTAARNTAARAFEPRLSRWRVAAGALVLACVACSRGAAPAAADASAVAPAGPPAAGQVALPPAASSSSAPPVAAAAPPVAAPPVAAAAPPPSRAVLDDPCPAGAEPAAPASGGYDRLLSGYAYPYEVRRLTLGIQGVRLCMAYMDVAPAHPNGQVVLLLHGKNFSGAYWRNTADALVARGYRVVLPDQIGFGKSSKPTNIQYSFDLLAKNTLAMLDALGVTRVTVVGHSMGGMLATRIAAQYPERVERLVLVNPIGLEDYRAHVPYLGVDGWEQQAAKQDAAAIRQYMQRSYFHDTWAPAYDPLLDIQAGWAAGPDRALLARVSALTSDMIYSQPVLQDFPRVKVPTLLVIGQEDRTAPGKSDVPPPVAAELGNYPVLGERAARAIPGARLVRLAGVGHVPQYEAFERWQAALLAFLPGVSPADPATQPQR